MIVFLVNVIYFVCLYVCMYGLKVSKLLVHNKCLVMQVTFGIIIDTFDIPENVYL